MLTPAAVQAHRQPRTHLRLLRAHRPVGRARPSASACTRVATQRAADRLAAERRLRGPRPADGHLAAARRRQARARPRLPRLPGARSTATRARPSSASTASAASSASTTRSSAACWRAAGGCPRAIASAIERHHAEDADGEAALVRLADMLAHYAQGARRVARASCCATARTIGLGPQELREVMYDLPCPPTGRAAPDRPVPALGPRARGAQAPRPRARSTSRSRTSSTLSTSTVRTHLHNVYGKLGAVDRAQAVLIATERGWL